MNISGNTTPGRLGVNNGSGRPPQRTPFGHLTVTGKAGEVIRIDSVSLYQSHDTGQNGIYAQVIGGSVQIDSTLAEPDLAMNPLQDAGLWIADTTLAPGSITRLANMGTAIKITFTTAAVLYLQGC